MAEPGAGAARPIRIGIIGAGAVGTALAVALARAGVAVVAVASRRRESAARLAAVIPGCRAAAAQAVVDAADLVFLTVPDDAIAAVAAALAWRPGQAAVHCSGALPAAVLAPVARQGAQAGGFHPLQTFAGREAAPVLASATVAIEAEPPLWDELARLAESLGCAVVRLRAEDRPRYHAAAVLASNYVVTLLHLATALWGEFGAPPETALRALLPLVRGTVDNLERVGLPAALTGPIARGDAGTIRRHLAALHGQPAALAVYTALGQATVPVARAKGSLDAARAREIARLLDPYC